MLSEGKEFTICWLVEADATTPLVDFLIGQQQTNSELAATAIAYLKRVRYSGNHGEPLTKAFTGKHMRGILEIRAKTPWGYLRMPFVYDKGQKVIVLNAFIKKSKSLDLKTEKSILKAQQQLKDNKATYEEIDFSSFE